MAGRKGGSKFIEQSRNEHQHSQADKKMGEPLDEQELEALYAWVDSIPISRPKKNIARDFSDGVLVAEVLHHFFKEEGLVQLNSVTSCMATKNKLANWYHLNSRVFNKLNFELADDVIKDLVCCKPGMIEKVLLMLQVKIDSAKYARDHMNDKPEADQHQASPGRRDGRAGKFGGDAKTKNFGKAKQEQESKPSKQGYKPVQVGVPKKRMGPLVEPDMVPRYVVEEKEQEILSRDETVQILTAKIAKLEHLLHLKDMRISELEGNANGYAADRRTNYNYRVYNKQ